LAPDRYVPVAGRSHGQHRDVAIGFARRADGSTALAAVVGYLTFNGVYTSLTKDLDTSAVPGVLGGITIGLTAAIPGSATTA
jgi:phosphotransferase system  glucose/maltose/N-acetylglucosamine-specific IIC component